MRIQHVVFIESAHFIAVRRPVYAAFEHTGGVETIPHSPAALYIRGQVGRNSSEISIHHRLSYRNSRDRKTGRKFGFPAQQNPAPVLSSYIPTARSVKKLHASGRGVLV